jgi:hypothetical protein
MMLRRLQRRWFPRWYRAALERRANGGNPFAMAERAFWRVYDELDPTNRKD